MIERLTSAVLRAFLVAVLLAFPAMLLPDVSADTTQMVVLLALLGAAMTFVEYHSTYPSLVEFRYAPPFNRLRFGGVFFVVVALTLIMRGQFYPSNLSALLFNLGIGLADLVDFPYSPVRLMVVMMPAETPPQLIQMLRIGASVAYATSLIMLALFIVLVKILGWPTRNGAFNVWVNLPMFDPTAGGDVLQRLYRHARIKIALGFLLPFLIPAVVKAATGLIDPSSMRDSQTLIWAVTLWAFLPASLIMRGVAVSRIAEMVADKRRRAYAAAEADGLQLA